MNGQTLNNSTVSLMSTTEEKATVESFDQRQNGDVVTPEEKEKIKLTKKIVYPLFLLFGTFGNVMTIAIHKRTAQTSPLSAFFIALAVADLVLLYFNCFPYWIYIIFRFHLRKQNSLLCKVGYFLLYTSGVLSAWTLVAMTAQRAVCVLFPHRASVLCTVGKSKVIVVSMTLFIAAIHVHIIYGHDLKTFSDGVACTAIDDYQNFFFTIWSWVDLFIFSLLPWLCLAVCNSLLVWKLNVSIREAEVSLGSGQADRIEDRKKKAKSITVTLVTVSIAFLVLTLPMSLLQIVTFVFWMKGTLRILDSSRAIYFVSEVSYPLWYANSCINFYVYCLTGSKFRREAKQILSCVVHGNVDKLEGNTTVSTLSSTSETRFS